MFLASSRNRSAFTLIESLVVIAISGVLIGILVPAVMKARASAVRLQCENNLRQVSLAMHNYVSQNGGFPSSVTYSLGWDKGSPTGTVHLWSVYLLPYLDQQGVGRAYDFDKPFFANTTAIATPLGVFECPATPEANRSTTVRNWMPSTAYGIPSLAALDQFLTTPSVIMAAGDYAAYAKVHDDWKLYLGYPPDAEDLVGVLAQPPYPSADDVKALLAGGKIPLTSRSTRPNEVTDGLSNTILLIEDAGKPQRWQLGQVVDPGDVVAGAGWADPAGYFFLKGDINSGCLINCLNDRSIYSFHTNGANFAFSDGSVRFLSTSISLKTLVALLTAKSGDVPGSDW
jgi:prepilin-type N-terminal cleavage/methylation domain-containing protein/prepilin-type processing-associated H-X9-DG protein